MSPPQHFCVKEETATANHQLSRAAKPKEFEIASFSAFFPSFSTTQVRSQKSEVTSKGRPETPSSTRLHHRLMLEGTRLSDEESPPEGKPGSRAGRAARPRPRVPLCNSLPAHFIQRFHPGPTRHQFPRQHPKVNK